MPIFVTLTYPSRFPEPREAKANLRAVLKRFERAWGPSGGWWKLEPQERGAPHFHIVLLLRSRTQADGMAAWWADNWHDIAGQGDPNHLKFHRGELGNKPCVEVVTGGRAQLLRYLAKYVGKPVEGVVGWNWPGRFWGKIKPALVADLCSIAEGQAPVKVADRVQRVARKYLARRPTGRYRIELWPGCIDRRRLQPGELETFARLGWFASGRIRPIFRKPKHKPRSGVGVMAFLAGADRLLAWAWQDAGLAGPPELVTSDGEVILA